MGGDPRVKEQKGPMLGRRTAQDPKLQKGSLLEKHTAHDPKKKQGPLLGGRPAQDAAHSSPSDINDLNQQVKDLHKIVGAIKKELRDNKLQSEQAIAALSKGQDDIIQQLQAKYAQDQQEQDARDWINLQVLEMFLAASMVQSALNMAYHEFDTILRLPPEKSVVGEIILSLAEITLPELAPIKHFLEKWEEHGTKLKKFAGLIGQEIHPYMHYVVEPALEVAAELSEEHKEPELNILAAGESIMSNKLQQVYHIMGLAVATLPFAWWYIRKLKNEGEHFIVRRVKEYWLQSGLEELHFSVLLVLDPQTLNLLKSCYLYDMLRAYAHRYCSFLFNSDQVIVRYEAFRETIDYLYDINNVANWPENGDAVGIFQGMNYPQRKQIYERFGKASADWRPEQTRPPINDYRDMIIKWRLEVRPAGPRLPAGPASDVNRVGSGYAGPQLQNP